MVGVTSIESILVLFPALLRTIDKYWNWIESCRVISCQIIADSFRNDSLIKTSSRNNDNYAATNFRHGQRVRGNERRLRAAYHAWLSWINTWLPNSVGVGRKNCSNPNRDRTFPLPVYLPFGYMVGFRVTNLWLRFRIVLALAVFTFLVSLYLSSA